MSENNNYRVEFVKRTKEILEEYYLTFEQNDREVTFLLNCILGLIVTVSEKENQNDAFNGLIDVDFLNCIPDKVGFVNNYITEEDLSVSSVKKICLEVCHKGELLNKKKRWFLTKLRNAIAHQNISAINENGEWKGVKLWNNNNWSKKDFEIVFTIEELKNLAIKLSNYHLNE